MFKRILVFVCFCFVFSGTCLSAEKTWYPKASDNCASFSAEAKANHLYSSTFYRARPHGVLWRDKTLFKLQSDINAALDEANFDSTAPHKDDPVNRDITVVILLSAYCDNHGTTRLSDLSASDVLGLNDSYKAVVDWYRKALDECGSDSECVRIATSYRHHFQSCYRGDQQACADGERDRKDWVLRANSAASSTTNSPQDPMMQCLQDALRKAVENCRQQNCPNEVIPQVVRVAQQAQCGYSAIEAEKPIYPVRPQLPAISNCTSTPMVGGGFTTDCTQD